MTAPGRPAADAAAPAGTWRLPLPWPTPPLSLNDRCHWSLKARKVRDVREQTGWLARAARIGHHERIRVQLVYTPATGRRRDPDNLVASTKPMLDGLVDAGVIPDDTPRHVEQLMPRIDPPDRARAGLVLLVEALPPS